MVYGFLFVCFLLFLFLLLDPLPFLLLLFGSELLWLFKSPFEPLLEIFHAFNFSVPELIHCIVFIANFPNQSERKFQNVKCSFLTANCQNVLIAFVEFHWWNTNWSHWVLHRPFVWLIHEIPNVNRAVWFTNKNYTCTTWTPAATCLIRAFRNHTGEYRSLNLMFKITSIPTFQTQK